MNSGNSSWKNTTHYKLPILHDCIIWKFAWANKSLSEIHSSDFFLLESCFQSHLYLNCLSFCIYVQIRFKVWKTSTPKLQYFPFWRIWFCCKSRSLFGNGYTFSQLKMLQANFNQLHACTVIKRITNVIFRWTRLLGGKGPRRGYQWESILPCCVEEKLHITHSLTPVRHYLIFIFIISVPNTNV